MRFIHTRALLITLIAVLMVTAGACGKSGKQPARFEPGGTWLDEMRSRISEKIDDPTTATALLAQVDQIEAELDGLDGKVKAYYEKLAELDRDYATPRADIERVVMDFNQERMATMDRLVDIRFHMQTLCTPEQWKIVTDIDKSLYLDMQRTFTIGG